MDKTTIQQQDTYLDVLVSVEKDMDKSAQTKVIFAIPETEEQFEDLQKKTDFKKVVWQRLYSLGYAERAQLKKKSGPKNRTAPSVKIQYKQAVRKFQNEAGTVPDGWVGLETWASMQELFTFEHDSNLQKWFQPEYKHILARATHLRLMMLGLVEKPSGLNRATGEAKAVENGLSKWHAILKRIDSSDVNDDTDEQTLIDYLFDIDRLTKLVAANSLKLRMLPVNQNLELTLTADDVLRFQKSLLKIELWLYGFEGIAPGNRGTNYKVLYVVDGKRDVNKNPLAFALSEFMDEFSIDVPVKMANDESSLTELALKQLAGLNDDEIKTASAQLRSETLVEKIEHLQPKQHKELVNKMRSGTIGDWLFDGVKRIYRWLKKSIVKVFDFIKGAASTAGKLIYKLAMSAKKIASEAYSFVRRGFKVLVDGFNFLARNEFRAKDDAVVIHKSTDMDTIVFVQHGANTKHIDEFNSMIRRLLIRAKAAMAIANFIIDETLYMVRNIAISGPISIVSLLIRIYRMRDNEAFTLLKQAYETY